MNSDSDAAQQLKHDITLAALHSHDRHMKHIYGLRWGGLALAGVTIITGAVMILMGLQGTLDWAFEAPATISAKLTNASPGIVFATIGMILAFKVVNQKPVNYLTGAGAILDGRGAEPVENKTSTETYPPIIAPWGD